MENLPAIRRWKYGITLYILSFKYRVPNGFLDYEKANLVSKYLSSKRSFLKSFDVYLQQV